MDCYNHSCPFLVNETSNANRMAMDFYEFRNRL